MRAAGRSIGDRKSELDGEFEKSVKGRVGQTAEARFPLIFSKDVARCGSSVKRARRKASKVKLLAFPYFFFLPLPSFPVTWLFIPTRIAQHRSFISKLSGSKAET